ncbi:PREDICTED: epidermal growth factor receptor substrate 15-like 1 [Amphimedon queenslandica]|uniref:Epidermal growth factor receptor substrate 15-like 1 n=1 Tax=Amphimedon queenslandica TaxID=400682 RepID=A0A1X7V9N0_AMPQE|nr:PREDICTED: epidermal growth factor receptor substrate 15-like 1 [Amphimedon queenslandica]|eukprot:XP_003385156.1 PREDICTED: epidermal growth factor receptor substrate 15-like 1 [Amphimedon queenslandica]
MAGQPPLPPNYIPVFESYWLQLEGSSSGDVNAITAAAFLKKSQLKEALLHKIWDLSDPGGKGYLDKQGFFTALRLVSACQCGREPSLKNIQAIDPPPKFVGVEPSAWAIDANERSMSNARFERLQPINGLLSGEKVRNFLMQSQLPVDVLGKIWNLSDLDRDGSLDADEFAIALKLTSLAQKGEVLPLVLPQSLIPSTKAARLGLAPPAAVTGSLSTRAQSPVMGRTGNDWVVTPDVKAKYDTYFAGIDKDHDGIVNGEEAKSLFMSSNLPPNILAHIWRLCDMDNTGRLNKEQFALAMYLIAEKVKGREVPTELAPNMIPPSKRKGAGSGGGVAGGVVSSQSGLSSTSSASHLVTGGAGLLQPTSSNSLKQSSPSSAPPSLFPSGGGGAPPISSVPSSLGGGAILQPSTTTQSGFGGSGSLLQPVSVSSQSGFGGSVLQASTGMTGSPSLRVGASSDLSGGFSADFSAIRDLDTISGEIEGVKKEKEQLQQDIMMKKEQLAKGKEETVTMQGEYEETTKLNQQLEQQKKELQSNVEEITLQKNKLEGMINDLKAKCQQEKEEIEVLKAQYKEVEESKSQQESEMSKLQQQFSDLKQEEESLKNKIESTRSEIHRMQTENQSVQRGIDQVKAQIDEYRNQQGQLSAQLSGMSVVPSSSSDSNVHPTAMRVGELPTDLPPPNLLGEPDAVSARATAGSSSPVSSISGFSTASHLEDQSEERERTDTVTAADPFASFPDPFTGASVINPSTTGSSAGAAPPTDFSFDPFGIGGFNKPSTTSATFMSTAPPTISTTTPPPSGTSDFANFSAFGSNFSSLPSSSASSSTAKATSSVPSKQFSGFPSTNGASNTDPFGGGSDPFSSTDPFSSVTTPKAGDMGGSTWDSSPFGSSDPFASAAPGGASGNKSSDPFFSSDPFGASATGSGASDPFSDPFGSGSGSSSVDPFGTLTNNPGGGGGAKK